MQRTCTGMLNRYRSRISIYCTLSLISDSIYPFLINISANSYPQAFNLFIYGDPPHNLCHLQYCLLL